VFDKQSNFTLHFALGLKKKEKEKKEWEPPWYRRRGLEDNFDAALSVGVHLLWALQTSGLNILLT